LACYHLLNGATQFSVIDPSLLGVLHKPGRLEDSGFWLEFRQHDQSVAPGVTFVGKLTSAVSVCESTF
jgi:hypothetical protein